MAINVTIIERRKLAGLDGRCCWTYEITRDEGEWQMGETVAIGLDPNTVVADPAGYKGCSNSTVNPARGKARVTVMDRQIAYPAPLDKRYVAVNVPAQGRTVTISFVAGCAENNNEVIDFYELNDRTGRFTLAGSTRTSAPAVAGQLDPRVGDAVAFIAHYEGMKLGKLFNVFGVGPVLPPIALVDSPVMLPDGGTGPVPVGGCGCG